ncbi:phosphohistidine phosphatase [Litorihabitans aurantiacus]|uniref:Phosphohistidine phosphatase n=1 Tax=Litorihabitans aurantiacus TaxID=1930061 RepID=A0AA37XBH7_9MICO|nr:phosphohistidine phosphatase [Litorihabitans aurantiacus]
MPVPVPRTLVLMRHASAQPWADADGSDHDRELTSAGLRQAAAAGRALAGRGFSPDLVLVSSAVRTRQTWEQVAAGLPRHGDVEVRDDLYDADAGDVAGLLTEVDDAVATVLVIGHEPVISSLARRLASAGSSAAHLVAAGVPTATRCVLEVDSPWSDLAPRGADLVAVDRTPTD